MDIISTLERAVNILSKHGASMLQEPRGVTSVVQAAQGEEDSDSLDDAGAPDAAVYEGHSGGIVDVLQSLLDKAQEQLDGARQTETADTHNFEMLKQSLEDSIKFDSKDFDDAKKSIAASGQAKAAAEGDLAVTSKEDLHQNCLSKAQDFELETKSRAEELKALADAKKVLKESTGGADDIAYGFSQ